MKKARSRFQLHVGRSVQLIPSGSECFLRGTKTSLILDPLVQTQIQHIFKVDVRR